MNEDRSILASIALGLALLSAVAVAAGPLAIHAQLASPFVGFRIFALGLLASLPALALGLVALLVTRGPSLRRARGTAVRACLLAGALVLCLAMLAAPGARVPAIHDITTDPDDPPALVVAARAPENSDADLAYPVDTAAQQRQAYPDIRPIVSTLPPAEAYAAAQQAAATLGWEVVNADPAARSLEATATSTVFRFVDDVAVRIQPADGGSRIDVRSRSRVGRSDLGANAARIRSFAAELGAESQ